MSDFFSFFICGGASTCLFHVAPSVGGNVMGMCSVYRTSGHFFVHKLSLDRLMGNNTIYVIRPTKVVNQEYFQRLSGTHRNREIRSFRKKNEPYGISRANTAEPVQNPYRKRPWIFEE